MEKLRDGEEQNMGEGDGSVVEIACQCGRSACAEVITLPRCVYEEAQREPGRLLLAPGHELPAFSRLIRCDSFVVVSTDERLKRAI
jgi:hypothetical protein